MLLSRSYAPSPQLAEYIRRFYVFEAELPDQLVIEDFLLAETAFIRCLVKGDWAGEVAPGEWSMPSKTLLFGANAKPFKVRVKGSFNVIGIAIRPSAWRALFKRSHGEYADKLLPLEILWGGLADDIERRLIEAPDDQAKVAAMEAVVARRIEEIGSPQIDPAMARFENIARNDSTIRISDAASQVGLSVRQFERRCRFHFGLTPKSVLRRSRFLDMAAALRGFSSPSERDLAELRYFDQSHLNREFKRFTHMTPRTFKDAITPLQTAGLKLREESLGSD